jgi:hypothetical protein
VYRTALGSTQPPIQWVSGALSLEVKRPGREAEVTSILCRGQECVDLYLRSPIRLHGLVFSQVQGRLYLLPSALKGRDHMEDLVVDGTVILEWILAKFRLREGGLGASGSG